MEDRVVAKELDEWVSKLEDCKQLEETQVKVLCEKVSTVVVVVYVHCLDCIDGRSDGSYRRIGQH